MDNEVPVTKCRVDGCNIYTQAMAPRTWSDTYYENFDHDGQLRAELEEGAYDECGCSIGAARAARVLAWAILGCCAIVVSAVVWSWIFN